MFGSAAESIVFFLACVGLVLAMWVPWLLDWWIFCMCCCYNRDTLYRAIACDCKAAALFLLFGILWL